MYILAYQVWAEATSQSFKSLFTATVIEIFKCIFDHEGVETTSSIFAQNYISDGFIRAEA